MTSRIRGAAWFRMVTAKARTVAKRMGVAYPNESSDVMRDVHAVAERELGDRLVRAFERR